MSLKEAGWASTRSVELSRPSEGQLLRPKATVSDCHIQIALEGSCEAKQRPGMDMEVVGQRPSSSFCESDSA